MPDPLQLALFAQEFSNVVEFRSPAANGRRALFGARLQSRAGAATEGHTLSHTAKPGGDHGFSAFPAIDL
jgi:hypothetical protein